MSSSSGVVIVDKPSAVTSHQVVGRLRRLLGTRKIGHAGTLDPMATGVLILGVNRATRLLGHLALHDKRYLATVRLGASSNTDDADGEVVAVADASPVLSDVMMALALGVALAFPSAVPSETKKVITVCVAAASVPPLSPMIESPRLRRPVGNIQKSRRPFVDVRRLRCRNLRGRLSSLYKISPPFLSKT